MIPVHSLLDRIRWDPEFGRADFTIGYYDRIKHRVVQVPFARIQRDRADHFAFTAVEADGSTHEVPLHRVREVFRNGELIWRRPPPRGESASC